MVARRRRHHSRRGPRPNPEDGDALQDWGDWLDHQYVPGYYTGGRIPPFLRRSGRASPYGYVLVVGGVFTLLAMIVVAFGGQGRLLQPGPLVGLAISALQVGAGLRLARPRR